MKFVCVVLLVLVAALLPPPVAAASEPKFDYPTSATSEHVITFSGSHWKEVAEDTDKLERAIVTDVWTQLDRKFSFNTNVALTKIKVGPKKLAARVVVKQKLLLNTADAKLQHIWSSDEINSMITQGKFEKTRELYNAADKSTLTVNSYLYGYDNTVDECGKACKLVFVVSILVVCLMGLTSIIVSVWLCWHCATRSNRTGHGKRSANEPCLADASSPNV